jgi:hypothetical protein
MKRLHLYELISGKSPKQAGLSKEEATVFETKECSKALYATLSKEDVDEDQIYSIIRQHLDGLLSAVDAIARVYA